MKKLKKCLSCLLLGLLGSATAHAGINDGLVAYFPFNGNAKDESGNGHDGVVNGATLTTDRFGNANSAYIFDGVDDGITVNGSGLDGFNSMTISTWVKAENNLQSGIISKGAFTSSTYHSAYVLLYEGQFGGSIYTSIYPNDNTAEGRIELSDNVSSNYKITKSTWHHVVFIWDSAGYIKVYLDGNLDKHVTAGVPSKMASVNYPLYIGRVQNDNYGHNWFNGSIDDVRIYNRALSDAEIVAIYGGSSNTDSDNDGVIDQLDTCPNTPTDSWVNKNGCPATKFYTEAQMNTMVESILTWGDLDGDKKIGLFEAIHALRASSGVTTPAIK